MAKVSTGQRLFSSLGFVIGLIVTVTLPSLSSASPLCGSAFGVITKAPLPMDRTPIITNDRAKEIMAAAPKIGDYSVVEVSLSPKASYKIIVDTQAEWLIRSIEKFADKPVAKLDQKSVRAFLDHISSTDLVELLTPTRRVFQGEPREVLRDGDFYYLEELIASRKRPDLVVAIIGQALLERFAKKNSRIIEIKRAEDRSAQFGLLIQNGNAEVVLPGKCAKCRVRRRCRYIGSEDDRSCVGRTQKFENSKTL